MKNLLIFIFILSCSIFISNGKLVGRPLNIAHRGSSGMYPEHTLKAYEVAIEQGADVIECDLSITKDLHLICVHEAWINATSDVSKHPEFQDRLRTYNVYGHGTITDWFTIDFTLKELKTIHKVQNRLYRDQTYNGKYEIATFQEYIDVAKSANRTIGIYPEIKDPKWINSLNLSKKRFEDLILETLHQNGYTKSEDPCYIQNFDAESLYYVSKYTNLRLIQLIEHDVSDKTLDKWAKYVHGVGPWKDQIVQTWKSENGYKNHIFNQTNLIQRLHQRSLKVHPYTFRAEDRYLAPNYGQDIHAEFELFIKLGVDGLFTDFPASLTRYFQYKFPKSYPNDLIPKPKQC